MKIIAHLLFLSLILSVLMLNCSKTVIAEYGAFSVTIHNKGTSLVTDFEMSMVGSDDMFLIDTLLVGKSSDSYTFILPKFIGERPESWGDFSGLYTQNSEIKDFSLLNFEHNYRTKIRIEITDQSFKVIYLLSR